MHVGRQPGLNEDDKAMLRQAGAALSAAAETGKEKPTEEERKAQDAKDMPPPSQGATPAKAPPVPPLPLATWLPKDTTPPLVDLRVFLHPA